MTDDAEENVDADMFDGGDAAFDDRYYRAPAEAYIRGAVPEAAGLSGADLLRAGRAAGLRLHRFKRTMGLPRVARVIGALRGMQPSSLLDIGPGRGVFLWPLLDAFPDLPATVVEPDERRRSHLRCVSEGGMARLTVAAADGAALPYAEGSFDVVTALEVLEHQDDPTAMAREASRVAARFVLASVPSKPDDNPEHVQLFTAESLGALFEASDRVASVKTEHVLNHIILVARIAAPTRG
ncbi:MAG: class I SAM-dependent methyltransferase [Pseudomonadota bacterium]